MLTVRARRLLEVPQLGPKAVADILAVADSKLYLENSIELLGFRCRVLPLSGVTSTRDGELVGMRQHGRGVVVVNGAASSRRAQPLTAQLMPPPRRAPVQGVAQSARHGLEGADTVVCLSMASSYVNAPARSWALTRTSRGRVIVKCPSRSSSQRALITVTPRIWPSAP